MPGVCLAWITSTFLPCVPTFRKRLRDRSRSPTILLERKGVETAAMESGMEWRCSCGEAIPESGDGTALTRIRAHQMGQRGHRIEGLYAGPGPDTELLIAGAKRTAAEEAGYIRPLPPDDGGRGKKGKSGKTEDENLNIRVQVANIPMKPAIWGWIGLIMPMETRDDGSPYGDTNDGIAEWIYDVIELHGRQALAMASQSTMRSPQIDYIAQMIRGSIRLQNTVTPVAQTAEAEATTAESVLSDALQTLETRAIHLAHQMGTEGGNEK